MYKNADAEIRPELQAVVQEALEAEKFFIADKVFLLLLRAPSTVNTGRSRRAPATS